MTVRIFSIISVHFEERGETKLAILHCIVCRWHTGLVTVVMVG
jgi:hypothetical protein